MAPAAAVAGEGAVGARLALAARTSASVPLQDLPGMEEAASALLQALHDAYSEASFQAQIAELQEAAQGDEGKFLGLLGPAASRVQAPIFKRFGLPAGKAGVPLMKAAIKRIGKECPAVARRAGDLRELLALPREEPDLGALLAQLGGGGAGPRRREQEELDEKIQKWIAPALDASRSSSSAPPCGAAAVWAAAKVQSFALEGKPRPKLAQAAVYAANNACAAVRAAAAAGSRVPGDVAEWAELCRRCLLPEPRALAELAGPRGRGLLEAAAPALAGLPGPPRPRPPRRGARPLGGERAVELRGSVRMPLLGFGTWELADAKDPAELERRSYELVREALEAGYRHLDCALAYGNEAAVGRAIEDSGIPREELFVATKFSNFLPGMTPAVVEETCSQQLRALRLQCVDLYTLHAAPSSHAELLEFWRVFEKLHLEGKARALGISNCGAEELGLLLRDARVKPACLQNKLSVYFPGEQAPGAGPSLLDVCREGGLRFMGYSCVNAWPALLRPTEDPHVQRIAAQVGCTPAQVLIRWALGQGAGILVRSRRPQRLRENLAAWDLKLSDEDMQLLSGLAQLHHSTAEGILPACVAGDAYGLTRPI